MKMIIVTLLGGAVLGFLAAHFLHPTIAQQITDPGTGVIVFGSVCGFLGGIWGWIGKGMLGGKPKE